MPYPPLYVQTQGEDGLFRTVENGKHANISTAYGHYDRLCKEEPDKVHLLLRGTHITLRSDDVELADRPADSLL